VTTNEILLLAIRVVAEMVTRHESVAANNMPFNEYAMAPFTPFVRNLWWDVAKAPEGSDVRFGNSIISMYFSSDKFASNFFFSLFVYITHRLVN
jgi:hypothetical protein